MLANKAARNNPDRVICSGEEVAIAIEQLTGIPANKVSEDEGKKLLNLEVDIHQRMVGQEEAVKAYLPLYVALGLNLKTELAQLHLSYS